MRPSLALLNLPQVSLPSTTCKRKWAKKTQKNPYRNAYRRVVTGAVRGVDYIASLPEWNGKIIGVTGSSQGGFLSIAVAALDKRITFLAPVHDAMCDYEAEIHGVAGGWPHYFYKEDKALGAAQGIESLGRSFCLCHIRQECASQRRFHSDHRCNLPNATHQRREQT